MTNDERATPSSVLRPPSFVRFEVADTGPGIPPDELPQIFERFYRADKARARETGGSGLGLAIARSIVIAHRGSLVVERAATGGARFVIRLPRA